jgi:hypothetical protein
MNMSESEQQASAAWPILRKLLAEQPFAVLATQGEGAPYTSLVCIAESADLRWIIFPTRSGTRKFANLETCPQVALLADNRSNRASDFQDAVAVTIIGSARVDHGDEEPRLAALLLAKHPQLAGFLAEPDCRIAAVRVKEYCMVTRFEQMTRLDPSSGAASPSR